MSDVIIERAGRDYIEKILSPVELSKLDAFVRDKTLLEAVKKVVLVSAYNNGTLKPDEFSDPSRNFMLAITNRRDVSNEQMGQQARAVAEAIALVEIGFAYLESFKKEETKVEDKTNKAR